jgi:crotonobetainyl-CoA:carnitine CoA-transferase CaiB-like acyl-CoA transferase
MDRPMEGVRVLEVAQFTFVPAAGAVLADWGADIVKVEHAERGDAQRGLSRILGQVGGQEGSSFYPIMEGPNRGKRSIGIDLQKPESRPLLEELVRRSDVFLTNYLPAAREKLGLDLASIREINPDIIYVSGSGFGNEGPEAEKGGYDSTAFWARGGSADGCTPPNAEAVTAMPAGAYGDSLGGMTIAGGIAAALYGRKVSGEPSALEISLLALGAWANQFTVNLALFNGGPLPKVERRSEGRNPLTLTYRTADDRWIQLSMLQPGRYWPEFCRHVGREDLITDERFATVDALLANSLEAIGIVTEVIGSRTLAEWFDAFTGMQGQWAAVQNSWELGNDEALLANGRIVEVVDADGVTRKLVANPVKFDDVPLALTRAPQFAEHTDEILRELGYSEEQALDFKIAGAVT